MIFWPGEFACDIRRAALNLFGPAEFLGVNWRVWHSRALAADSGQQTHEPSSDAASVECGQGGTAPGHHADEFPGDNDRRATTMSRYAVLLDIDDPDVRPVALVTEHDDEVLVHFAIECGLKSVYTAPYEVTEPDGTSVRYTPGRPEYFNSVINTLSRGFAVSEMAEVPTLDVHAIMALYVDKVACAVELERDLVAVAGAECARAGATTTAAGGGRGAARATPARGPRGLPFPEVLRNPGGLLSCWATWVGLSGSCCCLRQEVERGCDVVA